MEIFPVLFYFTMLFLCERIHGEGDSMKMKISMPNVQPREDDSYICTSMKLPKGDSYIVGYEPNAHKETVHHMLLFGCDKPGHRQTSWNCGGMGAGACDAFESILFGWAKDAPSLKLPKDIGFKVGGKTQTKYLVVQIHYAHKLKDGQTDSSGLTVHMESEKQPNLASIYLLYANTANILPHAKGIHVDIACEYDGDDDIHAFAFRTHSHDLGRVITGYRVRNNSWKLLGKGDPHAPQAFYPMKNLVTIKKGDILAARCTYDTFNTERSEVTHIGATSGDEMCNFYMMYYRDAQSADDVPDACGDQSTLQHLFPSFPKDSDVALPPSGHHHHHHHHTQHTAKEVGPEGTKNVINSKDRASVHNPDPAVTETNNHQGLGDDVIPSDVVIPESNESREENNFNPTTEAWAQDGRQISNSVTDNAEPTTGYNLTDDVIDGEMSREKTIWDATDTTLLEKKTTRSPATESSELHGSERPSYVTPDVNISTSISEQTTPLSPFTVIPTTRHQENSSVRGDVRTERSTAEPALTSAHGGNVTKGQHGLNIVPSQKNDVVENVSVVVDWPSKSVARKLGQVTGLAVDSAGRVLIFHRAGRTWDPDTFNEDNTFRYPKTRGTIRDTTIVMLDAKSGKLLKEWGSHMFYLPHGLTVDHEDNVWVTDVGAHQVTKFPREKMKPSLTLGRHLIPGAGEKHFCKPTDVAVEKSGVFYVADGYCNARIMKFSRKGVLLNQWGKPSVHSALYPSDTGTFNIPHSLTLNEKHGMLYVADRENGRIQCFDTEGEFHKQISSPMFGGRVFAVDYNDEDDILYAVNGPGSAKVSGFTIDPTTGKVLAAWSPRNKGFSQPHAIISSGVDIYVAEIGPNRVWKLETRRKVDSEELNFVRDLNNAVVNKPSAGKPDDGGNADHSKSETKPSSRPAVVILAILTVPAAILLLVGLASKIRGRGKKLHKYDMMDETLTNHTTSTTLCPSTNCCRKPYHNMEELYLMDSDSDIEMFPDVRIDKK